MMHYCRLGSLVTATVLQVTVRNEPINHYLIVEPWRAPSTWVIAGVESGSDGFQPNRDWLLLDGVLTTTREFCPSLTVVERSELELAVVPSPGTSQSGPAVVTALGMMVVPGGQPATVPGGLP